jgi:hypothetical protein
VQRPAVSADAADRGPVSAPPPGLPPPSGPADQDEAGNRTAHSGRLLRELNLGVDLFATSDDWGAER